MVQDGLAILPNLMTEGFPLGMRVRLKCSLFSFQTGETQLLHALNDVVLDRYVCFEIMLSNVEYSIERSFCLNQSRGIKSLAFTPGGTDEGGQR